MGARQARARQELMGAVRPRRDRETAEELRSVACVPVDQEEVDAARAAGRRAVLSACLAQVLSEVVEHFGGVGAGTHPGGVRLGDADDGLELVGR